MVRALFRARRGSGSSMPSSNFIMKSTHRLRSERIAPTTAVTVSSGRP